MRRTYISPSDPLDGWIGWDGFVKIRAVEE